MHIRSFLCGTVVAGVCSLQAVERVWTGAEGANWTDADVWAVSGLPATAPENGDTVTLTNGTTINLTSPALDDTNRLALVQLSGNQRGTLAVGPGGYLPTVLLDLSRSGSGATTPGRLIVDGGYVHATGAQLIGTDNVNNPGRLEVINGGNYTNASFFRVYGGSVLVSNATFTALNTSYLHGSSLTSTFEIVDSVVSLKNFAIGRDISNSGGKALRNVLKMRSGLLTVGDLEIGHTGQYGLTITGVVEQTGGTLTVASGNSVRLPVNQPGSDYVSAVGIYQLDGGNFTILSTGDSLFLGGRDKAAMGFFTVTDGVFTNRGGTQVGSFTNSYGAVAVSNGAAVFERTLMVGAAPGATGEVTLAGGMLAIINPASLNVGNASNAVGRCIVSGGLLNAAGRNINIGSAAFGNGKFVQNGGIVSNSSTIIGSAFASAGTLIVSNGVFNSTGSLTVGNVSNATGRCEVDGGLLNVSGNITLGVVSNSTGALVLTGGAVSNSGWSVGNVQTATGSLTVAGGILYAGNDFNLGHGVKNTGSVAVVNMSGGKILAADRFILGSYGSASATLNGGEIEALRKGGGDQSLTVGRDTGSFGRLEMTGGALKGTNELVIARDAGSTGLVYVAGGDLFVNSIRRGGGLSTLALAGGTLHPYNRNPSFAFTATLTNDIGYGETGTRFGLSPVDKDGVERYMHATCAFAGNGGLAKRGAGTVTLGGALAYTGSTVVESGTLALSNSVASLASGVIEVQSNATLDVSVNRASPFVIPTSQTLTGAGSVTGAVRLASGATLSGGSAGAPAALTIQGDLTLDAGSTLLFNMLSGAYSRVHVTGNLSLPAAANLTVNGAADPAAQGAAMLTWGGSLNMPTPTHWTVTGEKDPIPVINYGEKAMTLSYIKGTQLLVR